MPEPAAPAEPAVHRLFIAGRWVESVSGGTFESVNPADTRDVVGRFQAGTAADAAMAITAADTALPAWRAPPHPSVESSSTGSGRSWRSTRSAWPGR